MDSIFVKLLVYVLSGISAITLVAIDLIWRDSRTIKFKRAKKILLGVFIVSFPLSVYLLYQGNASQKNNTNQANPYVDSPKVDAQLLNSTYDSVKSGSDMLMFTDSRIDTILISFIELSKQKYPKSDTLEALTKLKNDVLIDLGKKTDKVSSPEASAYAKDPIEKPKVISPQFKIPNADADMQWLIQNKNVSEIEDANGIIKLPSESIQVNSLYHNKFEINYSSKIPKDEMMIVLSNESVKHCSVIHKGKLSWKSGFADIELFIVKIDQPEDGSYIINYYTALKITNPQRDITFRE